MIHENRRFVGSQAGVVQPLGGHLAGAEAIGEQQDGLQLCLQIDEGSGVVTEWPDGVNQCGGSLETTQWNLVSGCMTWLAAKVELIWRNQS